jgi:hypothetical protein
VARLGRRASWVVSLSSSVSLTLYVNVLIITVDDKLGFKACKLARVIKLILIYLLC